MSESRFEGAHGAGDAAAAGAQVDEVAVLEALGRLAGRSPTISRSPSALISVTSARKVVVPKSHATISLP